MKRHLSLVLAIAAFPGLMASAADAPAAGSSPPAIEDSPAAGESSVPAAETVADVAPDADFTQPSRSPADEYAQRDPAFAKYVDLSLLTAATAGPDASLLADVALGLAEGERVLVRTHRSGLTADNLMARAAKLAVRSGDKATQERISSAAAAHHRPQWAKLIAEAKEFGGVSRDGPLVAVSKIDGTTVALLDRVRRACDVAGVTGQKEPLEDLRKEVVASAADAKIKSHLTDLIDGCVKSLPEKADDTGKLLEEFAGASRDHWITRPGDWGKKGIILFPPRPPESTSTLSVMSYATIRNPTAGPLIYFVNGQRSTFPAGTQRTFTLGTNSGNYGPIKVRFENGRGLFKEYDVPEGRFRFQWTAYGLDLFKD